MKEIKIKQVSSNRKGQGYLIHLGNGTTNSFASLRDANYFLAATNNFLTFKLHQLHTLFTEVWNKYHNDWFYFGSNRRNNTGNNLNLIELDITEKLRMIELALILSHKRCQHINGNYFTFKHLINSSDWIDEVVRTLAQTSKSGNRHTDIYNLDDLISRNQVIRFEIERYGKFATTKLFKVPTHISEDKSYTPDLSDLRIVA